jgi:acetolactate synthase-1/2/3 large subunit
VVAHEHAAVSMAHGENLLTGKLHAEMVHVNGGLANSSKAIINQSRDNIPMLVTSGGTPITDGDLPGSRDEFIHWTQEMFDQGGMIREFVKWDYELRGGHQLQQVVDRALSIAESEPQGPVYLNLPREVLAESCDGPAIASEGGVQVALPPAANADVVNDVAGLLLKAERPLVIARRTGRDSETVQCLAKMAERYAMPVVEFRSNYVCMPQDHPMHGGFDVAPWLESADVILTLDAPVPWLPKQAQPSLGCKIVHVGADPLFTQFPIRQFGQALNVTATPDSFLDGLSKALQDHPLIDDSALSVRRELIREKTTRLRQPHLSPAADSTISAGYASQCIEAIRTPMTTIFNEIGVQRQFMNFTQPHDFFGSCMAGGLGWALPAALGAQLVAPERQVIAAVGDGSYIFANPVACHQFAAAHGLPLLTIVFNNSGWDSVRHAARVMYPEGQAAAEEWPVLSGVIPSPDFKTVIEACGGYGEKVALAGELPTALQRCLQVTTEERRQVLLEIGIAD